ncbi:unnamed protein product [Phytophthora fragariaefolia]|uniref:Unnamed protein product n=1 Tax=Phytophthora fragariaefolia TaxID=1490495 RepID=A0A9W7CUI2_9STRA|nr:unnamed protein product [Phytophthora fragariaefolia]
MHVLTYLGRPLRSECCCYPVGVQWFRAVGEQDDFQVIPGACDEWYTPTADDIGARILVKVMIEDEDVLKTKMLEYGPIKEDPEVRSKVEMYLERKSVLFMGLRSISVQDGSEYLHEEELRLEMVRGTPNEFYLHLAQGCYVRLRAESNTVRDIIVLTLRAFCKMAVADEVTHGAVAQGLSPMLTLRKIAQEEEAKKQPPVGASANFGGLLGLSCMLRLYTPSLDFDQQTQEAPPPPPPPAPVYDLPWNRSASNSFSMEAPESTGASTVLDEVDEALDAGSRRPSLASSGVGADGWQPSDDMDDSLLMDAEALIGNAHKMGIQYQILPRAPKRISVLDIPDLQIIEAMEALSDHSVPGSTNVRLEEERIRQQQRDEWRRRGSIGSASEGAPEDHHSSGGNGNNADGSVGAGMPELLDESCIDKAIEEFMADGSLRKESVDVTTLRQRYVAIFCSLQRELHTYKQRVITLSKQLEEKQELNASFRKDIESLRSALTSQQLADKVYDLVSTDLQQLVKHTAAEAATPVPNVSY